MSVTYLIGAGASFYALPVVNQIPERYGKFISYVEGLIKLKYMQQPIEENDKTNTESTYYWEHRLLESLKQFELGIKSHSSVDTYAKKLYITNDDSLPIYKLCLSMFFAYEQILNGPDQRYDTMYASILKENIHDFPDNVNILSWNYDNQFEIAYSNYSRDDRMHAAKEALHIVTKNDRNSFKFQSDKFHIIKLNGTIGMVGNDGNYAAYISDNCSGTKKDFHLDDLMALVKGYKSYFKNQNVRPLMSFAWESNAHDQYSIIEKAVLSTQLTRTLVVIGYSFPYFNRAIDRALFEGMYYLDKVYIQDPAANSMIQKVEELCNRSNKQRRPIIIPYTDVSQFLIPNELD